MKGTKGLFAQRARIDGRYKKQVERGEPSLAAAGLVADPWGVRHKCSGQTSRSAEDEKDVCCCVVCSVALLLDDLLSAEALPLGHYVRSGASRLL